MTAGMLGESPSGSSVRVLAIDACGSDGGVALGRVSLSGGPEGVVEILGAATVVYRSFSARLLPAIAELLSQAGMDLSELAAIVVVNGPGSFTGIRVSLSAVKGLAEPAAIPVIAVSRLALLARSSGGPRALALLGAGRGDWYAGQFQEGRPVWEKMLSGQETVAALDAEHGLTVCEAGDPGLLAGGAVCEALARSSPVYLPAPGAAGAIRFALGRLLEGRFDDVAQLDGNYLRPSDAERIRLAASDPPVSDLPSSDSNRR